MRPLARSIAQRLAEPTAVSRHVQAILVVTYVLVAVPYNVARLGGSPGFWLVAMLACQVFLAAALGNVATLHRAARRPGVRVAIALLMYALWGMTSAVIMALVGVATGLTDQHIAGERLTVGVLFSIPCGVAAAVGVGSHRRHRELVGALESELDRLGASLAAAEARIAATRQELEAAIATDLLPRLAELRATLPSVRDGADVAGLHRQVAADVRALAHRLADEAKPWPVPVRSPRARGDGAVGLLTSAATVVRPVSPFLMTATLVGLAIVWATRIVGVETSRNALFAVPWMLAVLPAGQRLLALLAERPVVVRVVALNLTFALASVWGALLGTTESLRIFFAWSILLVGVGLGWTIAVAYAWDERQQVLRRELEAAIASLHHGVARTNQRLRFERDRLARVVHGPVQDRLVAARERLAAAPEEGEDAVRAAAALLDDAERLLARPAETPVELGPLLDGIATVWDGLATVIYRLDPTVADALRTDDAAAETAVEIIREGVSNAVRHGRSREVRVTVEPRGDDAFLVEVVGDGSVAVERRRVGLGTRYLEAATLEWRLDRDETQGSRLRAVVPWGGGRGTAVQLGGFWRP